MTVEKAIWHLQTYSTTNGSGQTTQAEHEEAKRTVIKALSQQTEDVISRQATVERLCKVAEFMNEKRNGLGSPYVMAALFIQNNKDEFPPVTPKQRTGHWIAYEVRLPDRTILNYRCSVCGRKLIGYNTETLSEAPFCHCGAKMVEKSEDKV